MADFDTADERGEELETLQSIYPELILDQRHPFAATIDLEVAPTKPLPVSFDDETTVHRLSYLPPLHIEIILQDGYPAERPPSVQLSTSWLNPMLLKRLEKEAVIQWDEYGGMQMLFSYISYLQEAAEGAFGLSDQCAQEPLLLPQYLKGDLLDYDEKMGREKFEKETFDCGVCLEPKKGSTCYRLKKCGHVFCKACLQDGYNSCIKEGDVNNVKCMDPDCGKSSGQKKERLLSPKELLQIPLDVETVKRFANLKRKKKMEADKSLVWCPREWCQGAMRTEKYPKITDVSQMDDSEPEDDVPAEPAAEDEKKPRGAMNIDRLVICEDCTLAFCRLCLASWHGNFQWCQSREPSELTKEDQQSLNFISQNTTPCPTCSIPAQKSYGCNHMTCFQCKSHFCYLCGAWLTPSDPYKHFNNPNNKGCYMRLMDLDTGDEANGGVQFGGARGAEQQAAFWEREAMRIQMEEIGDDSR
ncbi:RING finger protein-like protein [Lophiotrema nucula]|uniref:RBR-type E3 ubiquitin transferase n=1 Tax=Lophiotrema nucula TaxID=690887 RepID=A0A6A5ZSD7_9PLEO|nr:RING finger protein-like protein [Lophiotrema nucula]